LKKRESILSYFLDLGLFRLSSNTKSQESKTVTPYFSFNYFWLILSILYDLKMIYVNLWCVAILLHGYFYYLIELGEK